MRWQSEIWCDANLHCSDAIQSEMLIIELNVTNVHRSIVSIWFTCRSSDPIQLEIGDQHIPKMPPFNCRNVHQTRFRFKTTYNSPRPKFIMRPPSLINTTILQILLCNFKTQIYIQKPVTNNIPPKNSQRFLCIRLYSVSKLCLLITCLYHLILRSINASPYTSSCCDYSITMLYIQSVIQSHSVWIPIHITPVQSSI